MMKVEAATPKMTEAKLADKAQLKHMVEELFKIIDTNKNGTIEFDEMKKAQDVVKVEMPKFFPPDTPVEFPDLNKDGKVDLEEWTLFLNPLYSMMGEETF